MSKIHDFSGGCFKTRNECKYLGGTLETFVTISFTLQKINEDNLLDVK